MGCRLGKFSISVSLRAMQFLRDIGRVRLVLQHLHGETSHVFHL
jgi:hypothetical protein